ncbi:Malate Na(+) symporter [Candidatus Burkholderia brachyanthoides]|nr:Malate Na(+) symporter [Candidatus Burkholderia brachyanthoides]
MTAVSTELTLIGTGFVVARWTGMYPVEAAIVNATHSGLGGTGDVAIPTATNRMELMPFAQIATRIGGAITVMLAPALACLEIDRHEAQVFRHAETRFDQTATLPCLRRGLIDFEDRQPRDDIGAALREAIEPRAEDHVLGESMRRPFDYEILDEARPRDNRHAKRPREVRVHVAAFALVVARHEQAKADAVFQHMRQ